MTTNPCNILQEVSLDFTLNYSNGDPGRIARMFAQHGVLSFNGKTYRGRGQISWFYSRAFQAHKVQNLASKLFLDRTQINTQPDNIFIEAGTGTVHFYMILTATAEDNRIAPGLFMRDFFQYEIVITNTLIFPKQSLTLPLIQQLALTGQKREYSIASSSQQYH